MLRAFKITFQLIFCLAFLTIGICGQTKSTEEEIIEAKKRLVELNEKKIREIQQENQKLQQELGEGNNRNGQSTDNRPSQPVKTETPPTANNLFQQTSFLPVPDRVPAQPTPNNPTAASKTPPETAVKSETGDTQPTNIDCSRAVLDRPNTTRFDKKACEFARRIVENGGRLLLRRTQAQVTDLLAAKFALVNGAQNAEEDAAQLRNFFYNFDSKRVDKQVGAGANSSGTTSLAVKGGTPSIIGWAVENGSATSSISGNTVTVRVNPYNFGRAVFHRRSLFEIADISNNTSGGSEYFDLRKLSFGFSFDTSRGTDTPTFIISKQQLAAWSVRYEFINQRNPLSKKWDAEREKFFTSQTNNLKAVGFAIDKLTKNDNSEFQSKILQDYLDKIRKGIEGVSDALDDNARTQLIANVIVKETNALSIPDLMKEDVVLKTDTGNPILEGPGKPLTTGKVFADAITQFTSGVVGFKKGRDEFVKSLNKAPILTFEYTNRREVNAPDTSNFRLIWEQGLGFGRKDDEEGTVVDFTLNAEMTMFNKKPAGTGIKRIKDFDVAFQMEAPLKNFLQFSNTTLSGTLRYTRQQSDVVLPNGVVADGTKGDILFGQVKLTIPVFDTGIKLPFSLTFGNRSEFIKEKFARANFGFTFDLDQLFKPVSLFK